MSDTQSRYFVRDGRVVCRLRDDREATLCIPPAKLPYDGVLQHIVDCLNLVDALAEPKQAFGRGLPNWHKEAKRIMR